MLDKYHNKYIKLFQDAQKIVVVSEHMKEAIVKIDCDTNKIIYSPAGPALGFFEISPSFQAQQLLAVGRFVDKKAPHLTLLAFHKVLKKVPNATLVMAGDGPLWSVCKDLVKALEMGNVVKFVGRISTEEHQRLLEKSMGFVQHSKVTEDGDSEGTPVAILEASAAGLPIVSTLHAGIPNTVNNNVTGFLVPENDVEAMAEKMLFLLNDKVLAKKMGAAGKAYVSVNFTLEKHIQKLTEHIEAVKV